MPAGCGGGRSRSRMAARRSRGRMPHSRSPLRTRSAPGERRVALAQRDLEVLGEMKHHLATRPRPSGLEEADVARGDGRVQGSSSWLRLRRVARSEAARRPERVRCSSHAVKLARSRGHRDYLAGNGAAAASPRAGSASTRAVGSHRVALLSGGPLVRGSRRVKAATTRSSAASCARLSSSAWA